VEGVTDRTDERRGPTVVPCLEPTPTVIRAWNRRADLTSNYSSNGICWPNRTVWPLFQRWAWKLLTRLIQGR